MQNRDYRLTGKDILLDPKNGLGDDYDPTRQYSLVFKDSPVGQRRLGEGWEIVKENVQDSGGTTLMILIASPKGKVA